MGLISSDVQIKIRWPPIEGEDGLEAKHSGQLCRHGNHVFLVTVLIMEILIIHAQSNFSDWLAPPA